MTRFIVACGIVLAGLLALALAIHRVTGAKAEVAAASRVSPMQFLAAGHDADFARIEHPYAFRFPRDYGAHPAHRTEWWQLSGVLQDERGEPLGVQLIVLRLGLGAAAPDGADAGWGASEIYLGLASISDPDGEGLVSAQRLTRGGIGLAGWQPAPMRLWVEDWQVTRTGPASGLGLNLAVDDLELDLELRPRQSRVDLNEIGGDGGVSDLPFVYYLEPRLAAFGSLARGGKPRRVAGTVSVEHAWGELPLPGGPVAQDRLTLYLDDGRVLLLIRTHRTDGSGVPRTSGLLLGAGGGPVGIPAEGIEMQPLGRWTSAATGARYPVRWSLRVPSLDLDAEILAAAGDAEGLVWEPFWAGPVRLQSRAGAALGDGFMQLSGYQAHD